jgi:hypothetical protein
MDYKTYTIRPRFRRASCEEVECKHWQEGWTFSVEMLEADKELNYIARHAGRRYEERVLDGKRYLVYSPGQPCFASNNHKLPIDEKPFLFVGRGDYRTFNRQGLPPAGRQHTRTEDWVDDFATHQDTLAREIEKG